MTTIPIQPRFKAGNRHPNTQISLVVMHATAGSSLIGAIETLRKRGLSYHYLIDKNGKIYKGCPYSLVAYHAGSSYGPKEDSARISIKQNKAAIFVAGTCVNSYSIGIAFVNKNDGIDPYTKEQFDAAEELINELSRVLPLKHITTHYWVSPRRKTDPKGFDIVALAEAVDLDLWIWKRPTNSGV